MNSPRSHALRGSARSTLCVESSGAATTQSVDQPFPRGAWERGKLTLPVRRRRPGADAAARAAVALEAAPLLVLAAVQGGADDDLRVLLPLRLQSGVVADARPGRPA